MLAQISKSLSEWPSQRDLLVNASKKFVGGLEETVFPADALFLSAMNRALQQQEAFRLLSENLFYSSSASLLRMQLDSILRLYGLLLSEDPHEIAHRIINGEKMGNLRDKDNQKMQDRYLVQKFAKSNPSIKHVYDYCCSHIHFSSVHLGGLLALSENSEGGRKFVLSAAEPYVTEKEWSELIAAFSVVTKGVVTTLEYWASVRSEYGSKDDLLRRFPSPV